MSGLSRKQLEAEIDRLYRIPSSEFVAARTALAKTLPREDAAAVKALQKPTPAAWAINQLFWRSPEALRTIEKAAAALGSAMRGAASAGGKPAHRRPGPSRGSGPASSAREGASEVGRSDSLRSATEAHRAAVASALRRAMEILGSDGRPVPSARRQEILHTLEALPGEEPLGRLTRPLEPRGFDVFTSAGLTRAKPVPPAARHETKSRAGTPSRGPAIDEGRRAGDRVASIRGRAEARLAERPEARLAERREARLVERREARLVERREARLVERREARLAERRDAQLRRAEKRDAAQAAKRAAATLTGARKATDRAKALSRRANAALDRARGEERRAVTVLDAARATLAALQEAARNADDVLARSASDLEAARKALEDARARLRAGPK